MAPNLLDPPLLIPVNAHCFTFAGLSCKIHNEISKHCLYSCHLVTEGAHSIFTSSMRNISKLCTVLVHRMNKEARMAKETE